MPAIYTINETCEYLKISRQSLMRLIHEGKLEAIKVLSDWRITEKAIEIFIKKGGAK